MIIRIFNMTYLQFSSDVAPSSTFGGVSVDISVFVRSPMSV